MSILSDFFGTGALGSATNGHFGPSAVADVEANPFSTSTSLPLHTTFTVTNNIGSVNDLNPQDGVDDVNNTQTTLFLASAPKFNGAAEISWHDMTIGGSTLPTVFGLVRGYEQGSTSLTYLVQYIAGTNTTTGFGTLINEWRVFTTGPSLDIYDVNGNPLANPNFVGNIGQGNFVGNAYFNVPEPGMGVLLGLGMIALVAIRTLRRAV